MAKPVRQNIRHLSLEEIEDYFTKKGDKKFRAKQLYEWLWLKAARSFDDMTNLPKELRAELANSFTFPALQVDAIQHSDDGFAIPGVPSE